MWAHTSHLLGTHYKCEMCLCSCETHLCWLLPFGTSLPAALPHTSAHTQKAPGSFMHVSWRGGAQEQGRGPCSVFPTVSVEICAALRRGPWRGTLTHALCTVPRTGVLFLAHALCNGFREAGNQRGGVPQPAGGSWLTQTANGSTLCVQRSERLGKDLGDTFKGVALD